MAEWTWNEQRILAAQLIAENKLTDLEIAERLDVTDRTLRNWKDHPSFKDRIQEIVDKTAETLLKFDIANKVKRIARLDKRWKAIDQVIEERGADPSHALTPGFTTGLLCHEQRSLGGGELATVIDIYKADVGLMKEEREIAKQAAQELGQWVEKGEISGEIVGHVSVDC